MRRVILTTAALCFAVTLGFVMPQSAMAASAPNMSKMPDLAALLGAQAEPVAYFMHRKWHKGCYRPYFCKKKHHGGYKHCYYGKCYYYKKYHSYKKHHYYKKKHHYYKRHPYHYKRRHYRKKHH